MKVSIITVCYNSEGTISRAISSVQSQTYSSIEHIIIDGASQDGTLAIIRKLADDNTVIISEPDHGIYDAMTKGINLATGDIIGILNSDDFYLDDSCVEDTVNAFRNNPHCSVVFGDVVFVGEDLDSVTRYYSSARFSPWKLRFGWMPPHPATFVRRTVYEMYGGYNQNYKISADYERFVRWLLIEKLAYHRIDRVVTVMLEGGVSTRSVKNRILLNKEIVKACRTNGIYTNLIMLMFKIPFKLLELVVRPKSLGHCVKFGSSCP